MAQDALTQSGSLPETREMGPGPAYPPSPLAALSLDPSCVFPGRSELGAVLPPKGHLIISGDSLGVSYVVGLLLTSGG